MKNQAIEDLSAVLVHNYYQNNINNIGRGGSLIAEILMQLREAGQMNHNVEMIVNHENLVIQNDADASLFKHEYLQSNLPDGADQEAVRVVVEQILRDFFYKV